MLQNVGTPGSWPASAVHDTLAAIMRQGAYQRAQTRSFADRIMSWIAEQLQWLFAGVRAIPGGKYIALIAAILLVVVVIARLILGARGDDEEFARARASRQAKVYTDPWREAERAAAEGRFTDAAHALNAAVIQRVTRRERLRFHTSKTHGDYARELRATHSSAYGPFREFGRLYDRVIYGRGECDGPTYATLLERAYPLLAQDRAA
jgi:uncharacterized protein DUF4129